MLHMAECQILESAAWLFWLMLLLRNAAPLVVPFTYSVCYNAAWDWFPTSTWCRGGVWFLLETTGQSSHGLEEAAHVNGTQWQNNKCNFQRPKKNVKVVEFNLIYYYEWNPCHRPHPHRRHRRLNPAQWQIQPNVIMSPIILKPNPNPNP